MVFVLDMADRMKMHGLAGFSRVLRSYLILRLPGAGAVGSLT